MMNVRLNFLCNAAEACRYTTPVTSRHLCCELKRLSRLSGAIVKDPIIEQFCEDCGSYNRRIKMISRKTHCRLKITCKLCGATWEKIITRNSRAVSSQSVATLQKRDKLRPHYHLKAAVLNKPSQVVHSPAASLKDFLYNDS